MINLSNKPVLYKEFLWENLYVKSKIHVDAKISENIAFDMVCEGQKRKKAYVTGLVAIFCQSSPPTQKSDIDFRRPLYTTQ